MGNVEERHPISVMLTARDMQKSVKFYRDTLGFEMREAWPDKANPQWASFSLDGQVVMLGAGWSETAADCAQPEQDAHAAEVALYRKAAEDLKKHPAGLGISVYLKVANVDSHFEKVSTKGGAPKTKPTDQFYGQRDFVVDDPDGYRLVFYTPVKLATCQSCGMPLKDAKDGQMYCHYCTDSTGQLKPYEQVLEGTTTGYYMAMQKMTRPDAEKAARAHLAKMPAWAGRK